MTSKVTLMRIRMSVRRLFAGPALALAVMLGLAAFTTTLVMAFNGGDSIGTAVTLPITPPGSFIGDSTGISSPPSQPSQRWNNVTWWSWTPGTTATFAVRATSLAPSGWDNTLEVRTGDGTTLVTQNDDSYGLDAQLLFTATAGTTYFIGLGGYNSASKGTATISFVEAPSTPTAVAAVPGNATALVSWTLASAGAEAVTSYRVFKYIGGVQNGTFVSLVGFPPATSVNMTGLTNGTAYTFAVVAVNLVGASPTSAQSSAVTPVAVVPGAPTAVAATAGDTSASVAFAAPASNGGAAITAYTVTSSPGGLTAAGAGSPLVVAGLTNGTPYTFRVTATNSTGTGPLSAASVAVTPVHPMTSQTIAFGALSSKALGDAPFTVAATGGSSGNPVTFSSTATSVCTVSGDTVTVLALGVCAIAADQAGNVDYTSAPTSTQSFLVGPTACVLTVAGGVLPAGRLAAEYSTMVPAGGATSIATFMVSAGTLPPGLTLASNGTISGTPQVNVSASFTVRVEDGACSASAAHTLNVGAARWITTGPGAGGTAHVRSFDLTNGQIAGPLGSFLAPPGFSGGVRVALADVNGDGVVDVVTGAGGGTEPTVRVYNGADGVLVRTFAAFERTFSGGVFVAAGDVNGDGIADIIVGSGEGRSPLVRVFDGPTGRKLTLPVGEFVPYSPRFVGGVRVAAGDVNGDGRADVITGAGPGGGPHVRIWNSGHVSSLQELTGFFSYDPAFRGGVYVAAGDVNGDGYADVVTGAGAGGGPHVRVWNVHDGSELLGFFAYSAAFAGGVRVAAGDIDGDGYAEIITGAGPGGGPHVRVWTAGRGDAVQQLAGFYAYDGAFSGGVFVAAPTPVRRMSIDDATPDPTVPGAVTIAGWAMDEAAALDAVGVSAIHVWAYPTSGGAPTFAGATTPTDQRLDVASAFGGQAKWSGFHLSTMPLPSGTYDLVVYALGTPGPITERTVRVTIP